MGTRLVRALLFLVCLEVTVQGKGTPASPIGDTKVGSTKGLFDATGIGAIGSGQSSEVSGGRGLQAAVTTTTTPRVAGTALVGRLTLSVSDLAGFREGSNAKAGIINGLAAETGIGANFISVMLTLPRETATTTTTTVAPTTTTTTATTVVTTVATTPATTTAMATTVVTTVATTPTTATSTNASTMASASTNQSTTNQSTTNVSTTAPTTNASTTTPTTNVSTTAPTANSSSTTNVSTTAPTTNSSSTTNVSTTAPTTNLSSTTNVSTTNVSTTNASTTNVSTTNVSTTDVSTTSVSTTNVSTTNVSTTNVSTTTVSTTNVSTTNVSTTTVSTTNVSTTNVSTTNVSTTTGSTNVSTNVSTTTASTNNSNQTTVGAKLRRLQAATTPAATVALQYRIFVPAAGNVTLKTVTTAMSSASSSLTQNLQAELTKAGVAATITISNVSAPIPEEAAQTVVSGGFSLNVSDAATFVTNTKAKEGVARGIANATGLDVATIDVTLTLGTRRLDDIMDLQRRLQATTKVVVSYNIVLPAGGAPPEKVDAVKSTLSTASTQLTSAVQAGLTSTGVTATVSVTDVSAPAVSVVATTTSTRAPTTTKRSSSALISSAVQVEAVSLSTLLLLATAVAIGK